MRNISTNILLFSAWTLIVFLIFSCSNRQMTTADIQGDWIPDKDSQQWITAKEDRSKCKIALKIDGTFSATVPDYLMKTSDKCSGRIMVGNGRWSLSSKLLQTEVKLDFSEVDGQRINWSATPLKVWSKGKGYKLFFYVGEEGGNRFVFKLNTTTDN